MGTELKFFLATGMPWFLSLEFGFVFDFVDDVGGSYCKISSFR